MLNTYRTYYRYLFRYKWQFFLFFVLLSIATAFETIQPYFFKLFIETSPVSQTSLSINILIIFIFVRFGEIIFNALKETLADVVVINAAKDVRLDVFKHLQSLDFAYHVNKSTGSLISIFRRGENAFYDIFDAINVKLYRLGVSLFITLCVFFLVHPLLAVVLLSTFILNIFLAIIIVKINMKARKEFNDAEDEISGLIADNMINFDTVKYFAKESWEQRRLATQFQPWLTKFWRFANSFRLIDFGVGTLGNLGLFLVLLFSINQVKSLNIQTSDYVMIVGFISSFYPRFFELVGQLRKIAKNQTDFEKYFQVLSEPIKVSDPKMAATIENVSSQIKFSNVSFKYPGSELGAISDINLTISPGESVAFVGHSGAGKTTLIKLLMRFYDVTSGEITLGNININNYTKSDLRSIMGIVPQDPIMFNNTIGFNIGYGADDKYSQDQLYQAAKLAHLHDFIETLPKKYDTVVGERGIKLSGGQKQRLAIARMIMSDPKIIIFDEATSQLDSESEQKIQDAFWAAARGKTTLIIAHRLSTVMRADKIVVMQNGKIVETGTHKSLTAKKSSLYNHFWKIQTRQLLLD